VLVDFALKDDFRLHQKLTNESVFFTEQETPVLICCKWDPH